MSIRDYLIDAMEALETAEKALREASSAARSGNDSTLPRRLLDMVDKTQRTRDELESQITRRDMGF